MSKSLEEIAFEANGITPDEYLKLISQAQLAINRHKEIIRAELTAVLEEAKLRSHSVIENGVGYATLPLPYLREIIEERLK